MKLLVRCCGKTQISTHLRLFLKHLSEEIDLIYSKDNNVNKKENIMNDFSTLKNTFTNRLLKATLKNPLVIILDGIESLKSKCPHLLSLSYNWTFIYFFKATMT
jgi:hypothetical protein